jgi:hypothetical protein
MTLTRSPAHTAFEFMFHCLRRALLSFARSCNIHTARCSPLKREIGGCGMRRLVDVGHSQNSISAALTAARSTTVAPTAFAAKEGSGIAGFLLHFAGGTFGGMAVRAQRAL